MSDIMCLGEFSQHEEVIQTRISQTATLFKRLYAPIYICFETKRLLKDARRFFYNKEYQKVVDETSISAMKDIGTTFSMIVGRQDIIVSQLLKINRPLAKPFIKPAIKNVRLARAIFIDKIQDFSLATNTKFLEATEKIFDGALNHELDFDKVPRLGSFV